MRCTDILKRFTLALAVALCAVLLALATAGCSHCSSEPEPITEGSIENSIDNEETVPTFPDDDGFGTEVQM